MLRSVVLCLVALSSSANAQSFPARTGDEAKTARPARVSLAADGPWLPTAMPAASLLEIYDTSTPRPRFGRSLREARLLFYVERDALQSVTVGRAFVQPSRAAAPKDVFSSVGFVPSPGTEVEVLAPEKNGLVKIRHATTDFEVIGFLSATSIGTIYRYDAFERPIWKPNAYLSKGFTLLDKPKGNAFVRAMAGMEREAMVLKRASGHALVRIANGAVGWIATKHVGRLPSPEGGDRGVEDGIEGGEGGVVPKRTLASGTPLFDSIDGAFVGVASSVTAKADETKGAWSRFTLTTPYGSVSVWASSAIGK